MSLLTARGRDAGNCDDLLVFVPRASVSTVELAWNDITTESSLVVRLNNGQYYVLWPSCGVEQAMDIVYRFMNHSSFSNEPALFEVPCKNWLTPSQV